jgi:hypothetical protein
MGHESITTTMQLYVRKTEDHDAILNVLDDDEDEGPSGGVSAAC